MADPEFRVYISSTIDDLEDARNEAADVIKKYAVVKDTYRATDTGVVETCVSDVQGAHLYVGIIGHRYGWVPDGKEKPEAKSITEIEYDACRGGRVRIPRLIFIRTNSDDRYRDTAKDLTAERVQAFRARAGVEQVPVLFDSISRFREALLSGIRDQRDSFHRQQSPQSAVFDMAAPWSTGLRPAVLLHVPGTDDAVVGRITTARPDLFSSAQISPADANIATALELALQQAQVACLVVTEASLKRMTEGEHEARFRFVLDTLARRGSVGAILRVDLPEDRLPPEWRQHPSIEVSSQRLQEAPAAAVDAAYSALRAAPIQEPSTLQRVALPVIVVAPTRAEVAALLAPQSTSFAPFRTLALLRGAQFAALAGVARQRDPAWPDGYYGDTRARWRWVGSKSRPVTELIDAAVAAINAAPRGSRERHVMKLTQVVVRHYDIDEFLDDQHGSRAALQAVVLRGALVCVDETALFQFDLREAARELVAGSRTAVASMSPCDPAHLSTQDLLDEGSFLFGALITRFRTEQDPQCELSLNSQDRLLRWLKVAIPQLLTDIEGRTGRATLVDRADVLLETGGGA
jgi:hypothetical protein